MRTNIILAMALAASTCACSEDPKATGRDGGLVRTTDGRAVIEVDRGAPAAQKGDEDHRRS